MRAIVWAFDHSNSIGYDRLVLLTLANHYNQEEQGAWPSIATMMREAGVSESTVKRSISALETLGELLVIERKRSDGGNSSNFYRFPLLEEWHPYDSGKGSSGATPSSSGTEGAGFPVNRNPSIRTSNQVREPEGEEPLEPKKEDVGVVFKEIKRLYRRKTTKSLGSLGSYGEAFATLVEKKTGDVVLETFKLWVEEQDREFLRKMNWPFAYFMKHVNEHIEAYEDKLAGENEDPEEEATNFPRLRRRAGE